MSDLYKCLGCGFTAEIKHMHETFDKIHECRHCKGEIEECQYHDLLTALAGKSLNNVEIESLIENLKDLISVNKKECKHEYVDGHNNYSYLEDESICIKCNDSYYS